MLHIYSKSVAQASLRRSAVFANLKEQRSLFEMWYEILPPVAIMGTCFMLPNIIQYYLNSWMLGNPMRRDLRAPWDCAMMERDQRISGKFWKTAGLENIPDN